MVSAQENPKPSVFREQPESIVEIAELVKPALSTTPAMLTGKFTLFEFTSSHLFWSNVAHWNRLLQSSFKLDWKEGNGADELMLRSFVCWLVSWWAGCREQAKRLLPAIFYSPGRNNHLFIFATCSSISFTDYALFERYRKDFLFQTRAVLAYDKNIVYLAVLRLETRVQVVSEKTRNSSWALKNITIHCSYKLSRVASQIVLFKLYSPMPRVPSISWASINPIEHTALVAGVQNWSLIWLFSSILMEEAINPKSVSDLSCFWLNFLESSQS